MRYLIPIAVLLLAGCAAISPRLDDLTGTTLDQRCADYRAAVSALDLIRASRDLTDSEQTRRNIYEAFIAGSCPPVE